MRVLNDSWRRSLVATTLCTLLSPSCDNVSANGKPAEMQPSNVNEEVQENRLPQSALVAKLGGQSLLGEPLAIISDSKAVLTKDKRSAYVWEMSTGKLLRQLVFAHMPDQMCAGAANDGKRLLDLHFDKGIDLRIWDMEKGRPIKTSPIKFKVNAFASPLAIFVPGSDKLAWIDQVDDAFVFWDLESEKCETLKMTAPSEDYFPARSAQLAFTRDGKKMFLAGSCVPRTSGLALPPRKKPLPILNVLEIWDLDAKKRLETKTIEGGVLHGIHLAADGISLATGGYPFRVWDVRSGLRLKAEYTLGRGWGGWNSVALSDDGKILTCLTTDGWHLAWLLSRFEVSEGSLKPISSQSVHMSKFNTSRAILSADGKLAAFGELATLVVDTATGKPAGVDPGPLVAVTAVRFTADGAEVATLSRDAACRFWEATTGKPIRSVFPAMKGDMLGGDVASDGGLVAATATFTPLLLHDVKKAVDVDVEKRGHFDHVAISPDSTCLASFGNNHIFDSMKGTGISFSGAVFWDVRTQKIKGRAEIPWSMSLGWSPDSRIVAIGTAYGQTVLVRAADGQIEQTARVGQIAEVKSPFPGSMVRQVAFSPDGRLLACGLADGRLVLLELASGKPVCEAKLTGSAWQLLLAYSPKGEVLATASDNRVQFRNAWDGKVFGELAATGCVDAMAFSPNGKLLATGGSPSANAVWRVPEQPASAAVAAPVDKDYPALWGDLASDQPALAYQAIAKFAAGREPAVRWLTQHTAKAGWSDSAMSAKVASLVLKLDDDHFSTREAASKDLVALGKRAIPLLQEALKKGGSEEVRHRLRRLLADLVEAAESPIETPIRVNAALERIGGKAAIAALRKVAGTTVDPRVASDAQAALQRLGASH